MGRCTQVIATCWGLRGKAGNLWTKPYHSDSDQPRKCSLHWCPGVDLSLLRSEVVHSLPHSGPATVHLFLQSIEMGEGRRALNITDTVWMELRQWPLKETAPILDRKAGSCLQNRGQIFLTHDQLLHKGKEAGPSTDFQAESETVKLPRGGEKVYSFTSLYSGLRQSSNSALDTLTVQTLH